MSYKVFLIVVTCGITACQKERDFLNEKTNIAYNVPVTIEDYQGLLNNESIFNQDDPALGALSSEEYSVPYSTWVWQDQTLRNTYTFASDVYGGTGLTLDWTNPYQAVFIANIVLDGIAKVQVDKDNQGKLDQLQGQALFYRSWKFYGLLENFSLPYSPVTAVKDLGIPLRLSPDFNIKVNRSSIKSCYEQIIGDLQKCLDLLPNTTLYKTQPNKTAAKALLARIYLGMGDYEKALLYADSTLTRHSVLLDFNTIDTTKKTLSNNFISEDIYHSSLVSYSFIGYGGTSNVDSNLIASYHANDLRRPIYFMKTSLGNISFKGSYDYQSGYSYSGLATDEIYLIRAECYARSGNGDLAMKDLNTLLFKRWKTGTYEPIKANSATEALAIILGERRKELAFRGLRWLDLRRLNREQGRQTTLKRILEGVSYTLPPNDPRYAMPIPTNEIQLNGVAQNIR